MLGTVVDGVMVVLPQVQPYSVSLEPGVNAAAVDEFCIGISVTTEPFTEVLMFCTVAVTAPLPSVLMP
ncbi:MAG: hypothetical protein WCA09_01615, partial [Burkholderiales bacterium]